MANEAFVHLTPRDLIPAGGGLAEHIAVGIGSGVAFPARQTASVLFAARVPESVTLATGLSLSLMVADDPNNPSAGKAAVFGVTVGPFVSGTTTFDENATTGPLVSTTEATGTVTLAAAAGVVTVLAIAVPVASMHALAAGGWCLIRIRRLGLNASDTHRGRVVLLGVDVRNT